MGRIRNFLKKGLVYTVLTAGALTGIGNSNVAYAGPSERVNKSYMQETVEKTFSDENQVLAQEPWRVKNRLEGNREILKDLVTSKGSYKHNQAKKWAKVIDDYLRSSKVYEDFDNIVENKARRIENDAEEEADRIRRLNPRSRDSRLKAKTILKEGKEKVDRLRNQFPDSDEFAKDYLNKINNAKNGDIAGYRLVELLCWGEQRKEYVDLKKIAGYEPRIGEWVIPALVIKFGSTQKEVDEAIAEFNRPEVLDSYFNIHSELRGDKKKPSKRWVNEIKKDQAYHGKIYGYNLEKDGAGFMFIDGMIVRNLLNRQEFLDIRQKHEDIPDVGEGYKFITEYMKSVGDVEMKDIPAIGLNWIFTYDKDGKVIEKKWGDMTKKILRYLSQDYGERVELDLLNEGEWEALYRLIDGRKYLNGNGEVRPLLNFFDTMRHIGYIGEVENDKSVLGPYGTTIGGSMLYKIQRLPVTTGRTDEEPLEPIVLRYSSLTSRGDGYATKEQVEARWRVASRLPATPFQIGGGEITTGPIKIIRKDLLRRVLDYYAKKERSGKTPVGSN